MNGVFSEKWKTLVVRPLIKKLGLELIHKSYRLVSNLSFFSKLIEKCALLKFNEHCNQYNLIPDFQSAYRVGYSTETALIKLVNDILWAMENQRVAVVVMLDLSPAFDTVVITGLGGLLLSFPNLLLRPRLLILVMDPKGMIL